MTARQHLRFQFLAAFAALAMLTFGLLPCGVARAAGAEGSTTNSGGAPAHSVVDLLTVGPTDELASRFGHSLLCVRSSEEDVPEKGHCFDYGVVDDVFIAAWTALRGKASHVAVAVIEDKAIAFFKAQGRQIERQRLPLSPEETTRLVALLDDDVGSKRPFVYHPYYANCATRLRDHLDAVTGGRLRQGPAQIPQGTFRDYMEDGHSGRLGILLAMSLYVGEPSDRPPTPWEAMMIPLLLRDGVAARFSVPPEKIAERVANAVPTSRAAGRIAIFAVALALFVAARALARRGRIAWALKLVGGVLGVLAISVDLASLVFTWTEIRQNWALLLLLPSDLALPLLGRRLPLYLKGRLALAALFAVLEISGVVHQPLLHLVALVALPMSGLLTALRQTDSSRREASSAAAAA